MVVGCIELAGPEQRTPTMTRTCLRCHSRTRWMCKRSLVEVQFYEDTRKQGRKSALQLNTFHKMCALLIVRIRHYWAALRQY